MIISHKRKFIFVHIPKTGGTSLALLLESKAAGDDILIGDTPKAVKRRHKYKNIEVSGRLWKHSKLIDIYGLLTQEQIEEYTVFTIVRNPWDRIVSYYHWLRAQEFDHPAVALSKAHDFTNFINHPVQVATLRRDNVSAYTVDQNGVDRGDKFFRCEALVEAKPWLEQRNGYKMPDLEHVNRSERTADYREAYSDADRDLIADLFAEDIERFGYQF